MAFFGENNWFRDDSRIFEMGLSPYAVTLRVFLAAAANSQGESWYSLDRMQQALNVGRHSLVKAVKELEERRLLIVGRKQERGGALDPAPLKQAESKPGRQRV